MKKLLMLCLVMTLVIVGCGVTSEKLPSTPPDVKGLIYDIDTENQRILVVSDIENVDVPYDEWFEAGKYAAFFKVTSDTTINDGNGEVNFSKLSKGQSIELWHTGILAESYPMQGEAVYIKIIN